jgi:hypothetical protein
MTAIALHQLLVDPDMSAALAHAGWQQQLGQAAAPQHREAIAAVLLAIAAPPPQALDTARGWVASCQAACVVEEL